MTTVFLSGYRGPIEHTKTDVSAQEVKSVLESLKNKANSGVFVESADQAINKNISQCYGLSFDKQKNLIQFFSSRYDAEEENCVTATEKRENVSNLDIYKDVQIAQLKPENILNSVTVYFLPPQGLMRIYTADGEILTEELQITLRHQAYTQYQKILAIDPLTGKIEILTNKTE